VIGDDGVTGEQEPVVTVTAAGVLLEPVDATGSSRTPTAVWVPSVAAGSSAFALPVVALRPTTAPRARFWPAATVIWSRE